MGKFLKSRWWVRDMTVFEALADGAFDHLNCQHTGNLTKLLQKKVKCPGICLGGRGGMGGFGKCYLSG